MAKNYRIHVHGKQREDIEPDLMAQLVMMFARERAQETTDDTATDMAAPVEPRQGTTPATGIGGAA